jgi:hypothetical protein
MTTRRRLSRNPDTTHPLGRMAVVYFGIAIEDYNIEEAAREGDARAQALLQDTSGMALLKLEDRALKSLSRMFNTRITNEGHDRYGDLVCKIPVNSWEDVKSVNAVINKHHIGGDDEIDTDVEYVVARGFRLYPDGVNDDFYGEESGAVGTFDEWLENNKPRKSAKAIKNPARPRRDASGRFVRRRR